MPESALASLLLFLAAIVIPSSPIVIAMVGWIAEKLRELGFVGDVEKKRERTLRVVLLYDENGNPRIRNVRRLSKPGRRLYVSHRHAHMIVGGTGVQIL